MGSTSKCMICGVSGVAEMDFICPQCGDPEKIIFTCLNCGHRIDLTQNDPDMLEKFVDYRIEKGHAIASSFCPECLSGDTKSLRVTVYQVKYWATKIRASKVIKIDLETASEIKEIGGVVYSKNIFEELELSVLLENAPLLSELSLEEIAERVRKVAREHILNKDYQIEDAWVEGNGLRILINGRIYEVDGDYLRELSRKRFSEA